MRIQSYDDITIRHSQQVAHLAMLLGRRMGFRLTDLETIYWTGLLHDLGKIFIHKNILLKKGRLTPEEYDQVKLHPVLGAEMLAKKCLHFEDTFHAVLEGVRFHHERFDGKGYPEGLSGNQIPLYSRILAVADVFDALTSNRSYREALPTSEAVSYLRRNASSHFDPAIVSVLTSILADMEPLESYESC